MNTSEIVNEILSIYDDVFDFNEACTIFWRKNPGISIRKAKYKALEAIEWKDILFDISKVIQKNKKITIKEACKLVSNRRSEYIDEELVIYQSKKFKFPLRVKKKMSTEQIYKKIMVHYRKTKDIDSACALFTKNYPGINITRAKSKAMAEIKWKEVCREALRLLKSKKASSIKNAAQIISKKRGEFISHTKMKFHADSLGINLNLRSKNKTKNKPLNLNKKLDKKLDKKQFDLKGNPWLSTFINEIELDKRKSA